MWQWLLSTLLWQLTISSRQGNVSIAWWIIWWQCHLESQQPLVLVLPVLVKHQDDLPAECLKNTYTNLMTQQFFVWMMGLWLAVALFWIHDFMLQVRASKGHNISTHNPWGLVNSLSLAWRNTLAGLVFGQSTLGKLGLLGWRVFAVIQETECGASHKWHHMTSVSCCHYRWRLIGWSLAPIKGPVNISMDSLAYPTQVWLTLVFHTPFRDTLMMLLLGYFGSD